MRSVLARLLYSAQILALGAWLFMLCEGSLALTYGWPTISYGHSVVACVGLAALFAYPLSAITYELVGSKDGD